MEISNLTSKFFDHSNSNTSQNSEKSEGKFTEKLSVTKATSNSSTSKLFLSDQGKTVIPIYLKQGMCFFVFNSLSKIENY